MVTFSFITFEVAVADVHDGDAPVSEIAKLARNAPGAPGGPDSPLDGPTHSIHVCHCAHPHGGLTCMPENAGRRIGWHEDRTAVSAECKNPASS